VPPVGGWVSGKSGSLPVLDKVKLEARRRKIALQIFPTDRDIRKLAQEPEGTNAVLVACYTDARTARPRRESPRTVSPMQHVPHEARMICRPKCWIISRQGRPMDYRPALPRRSARRRSVKRRRPTPGSPSRLPPNLWRYSGIGAELFSPIIGGSVAGYYIDEHFHTGSIWTLVGLLGGVFLGFYRLIAEVRSFRKNL
jgi:hypothetical protein